MNLTSQNIPKAVQFCLRDFRQCPIYQRYLSSKNFCKSKMRALGPSSEKVSPNNLNPQSEGAK